MVAQAAATTKYMNEDGWDSAAEIMRELKEILSQKRASIGNTIMNSFGVPFFVLSCGKLLELFATDEWLKNLRFAQKTVFSSNAYVFIAEELVPPLVV